MTAVLSARSGAGEAFGEIALLRETTRTTTARARTSLRLYTLEGRDFVSAVSGYPSSGPEADSLVVERLASFDLRRGPVG